MTYDKLVTYQSNLHWNYIFTEIIYLLMFYLWQFMNQWITRDPSKIPFPNYVRYNYWCLLTKIHRWQEAHLWSPSQTMSIYTMQIRALKVVPIIEVYGDNMAPFFIWVLLMSKYICPNGGYNRTYRNLCPDPSMLPFRIYFIYNIQIRVIKTKLYNYWWLLVTFHKSTDDKRPIYGPLPKLHWYTICE